MGLPHNFYDMMSYDVIWSYVESVRNGDFNVNINVFFSNISQLDFLDWTFETLKAAALEHGGHVAKVGGEGAARITDVWSPIGLRG